MQVGGGRGLLETTSGRRILRMSKRTVSSLASLVSVLLLVGVLDAHDVWLAPDRFALTRGDTLIVRQWAGTELETEHDLPLQRTITRRFELVTPTGTVDLLDDLPDLRAQPVIQPVLKRILDFEGLAVVVMEHAFIHEEFSREEFLEYVEHEEFDLERFRDHMGRGPVERERYRRSLKSLVQVGEVKEGDLHRRVLGQRMEILLLENPYLLDAGDELPVQVLFQGEPVAGQLVMAYSRERTRNGTDRIASSKARTDASGIVRFSLDRPGSWLLRLVYMRPCAELEPASCRDVDWESYWASYTFELD